MTEAELQAEAEERLTAEGWRWHHCRDSRHCGGPKGFPDLLAIRRGRLVVAEVKSDDGRHSREQLDWQAAFRAARIAVVEIRPETLGQAVMHIDRL